MTIAEILNALEGLRDLTNDNGRAVIESVKAAVRKLSDPEEVVTVTEVGEARLVHVEEEPKEEEKEEPHHKTTKKKK